MAHAKQLFHDLDDYVAAPRHETLRLSPDGTRLITSISSLDDDGTGYQSALWQLDPQGVLPPRRLTHGKTGESQPRFAANGDLLFTAKRSTEENATAELWRLPAAGGEAHVVASHPGGIGQVHPCPANPNTLLIQALAHRSPADLEQEQELRDNRRKQKVSAILHDGYPVRYWDHDLGPATPHLYRATLDVEPKAQLHDLTAGVRGELLEASTTVAPNGSYLVSTWNQPEGRGATVAGLVRIDMLTGECSELIRADDNYEYSVYAISPDSTQLAYARWRRATVEETMDCTLWIMDMESGEQREVAQGWDRWANELVWLPDASGVLITADEDGRCPLFLLRFDGRSPVRLTDEGAYSNLCVSPDGATAYALRASYEYPAEPVSVQLTGAHEVLALPSAMVRPELPGTLTEVETTAADGSRIRAWLALPAGTDAQHRAPLLLWVHGGPVASWNAWSWRWNPWLAVAQGYAVLLPDPALSTGYGRDFIQRGWGRWGAEPYTDLMAITDAVEAREDIDESRTAAMGGSFGGYMANWIAGHTDRFKAIVTHASLWALEGFGKTTDASFFWEREMSKAMVEANSPHHQVGQITTPMLVIHGDKDYRVPIGEGLRLWFELLSASGLPQAADGSTVHRFLYFPDENHWILSPQHAKIWYQVVFAYLAEHVLEQGPQQLPELLG